MSAFSRTLITRVAVRGFRSLENVAVALEPVTVLVGPNGSGKSSFTDALVFLQRSLTTSPQEAFRSAGGVERVRTLTGQRPPTFTIEIQIRSRADGLFSGRYSVSFRLLKKGDTFYVSEEMCEMSIGPERRVHRFVVERGRWVASVAGVEPRLEQNRLALPLLSGIEHFAPMYDALTAIYSYHVTPDVLRAWQEAGSGDHLAVDGSNAVSVLQQLMKEDQPAYRRIVQTISQIVPSIQNIVPKTRSRRALTLAFDEVFEGHENLSFEASSMSDGTLHVLGILLAAYQPTAPTLVVFEEPEMAIHPGAAAVLAEALQEAGLRTQILVTTHSPDLITRFDVESLRAVERLADGVTVIAPIAESQREAVRQRLFTAGELHRIEGLRPSTAIP